MQFDFLICSERSGSNLITKILNAHKQVCGPFPSHLFRIFTENYHRYGDLALDANWHVFLEDVSDYMASIFATWKTHLSADELRSRVTERSLAAVGRACYEHEAMAHGKSHLFVKENHTYRFADYLLAHFPTARFLWVVRDPRDMVTTWRQLAPGGALRASEIWRRDQRDSLRLFQFLRDIDRCRLVRFEELVLQPESTLRSICPWLGVDFEPSMLHFHDHELVGDNARRIVSWRDLARPLQPDQVGCYRGQLSEAEVRYVESYCAAEMAFFGYEPEYEPTDPTQLQDHLPPEDTYDRQQTEQEKRAYSKWITMRRRIERRNLQSFSSPSSD